LTKFTNNPIGSELGWGEYGYVGLEKEGEWWKTLELRSLEM